MPLGSLAEAYLEALATIEHDRMSSISSFVAVASQLILIKSRAMLPRPPAGPEAALGRRGRSIPEAELRARLLLYRAFRDAGVALHDGAPSSGSACSGASPRRRSPSGLAGATTAPSVVPLDPRAPRRARSTGSSRSCPSPSRRRRSCPRSITLAQRASIIRLALRGAPSVVLQDLLRGVHDRVVVAVTFLAMLELMKRREVVVEQAEPFGPITARSTTAEERAAAGVAADVEQAPLDESLDSYA